MAAARVSHLPLRPMFSERNRLRRLYHLLQVSLAQWARNTQEFGNQRPIQRRPEFLGNPPSLDKKAFARLDIENLSEAQDRLVRWQTTLSVQDST